MKSVLTTLLLIFILLSPSVFAHTLQPQGIEVSGKAAVTVTPDIFSLSFSIEKRGKSANKIKALVDQKTDQVINLVTALGISKASVQTAQMTLQPIYYKNTPNLVGLERQENFKHEKKGKVYFKASNEEKNELNIAAFEVTRYIRVQLKNINDYDRLLEQLVKLGVTKISPLTSSVAEPRKYYEKALAKAIQMAKQKALKLAAQAGVSLGKLQYLKETSYNVPMQKVMMSGARIQSYHSSEVGNQVINAEIIANYQVN
jgi:hypothetical protein